MKKLVLPIIIMLFAPFIIMAQNNAEDSYKFDLGVGIGMSGYLGDTNQSNLFSNAGFGAQAQFRYFPNARWAFRANFTLESLKGNTADWDNKLPGGENYSFNSTAYDLGGRVEFNFFNYGIGATYMKMRRWSPYLTLGVGVTLATCDGQSNVAPNIPMGVGVKYKLKPRWNLAAEFTMTKVFGDKVDGLSDLTGIKSSFIKNTDWYSLLSVSISYEFGLRCATCHYVE
jgi:hypothetical protein